MGLSVSARAIARVSVLGVLAAGGAAAAPAVASASTSCPATPGPQSVTFSYTGGEQACVIPTGVSSVQVTAVGAAGGLSFGFQPVQPGGAGAVASGTVSVTPGSTLYVEVGGAAVIQLSPNSTVPGGFNGGGAGFAPLGSAGGGGASDVRTVPMSDGLSPDSRLLVAGGGGGGGGGGADGVGPGTLPGGAGGAGDQPGADGSSEGAGFGAPYGVDGAGGGQAGSTTAGGAGGAAGQLTDPYASAGRMGNPGSLGQGGAAVDGADGSYSGAGGGGLYGGGSGGVGSSDTDYYASSGADGGGGGGSSYAPGGTVTANSSSLPAQVTISYTAPAPPACSGDSASTPQGQPVTVTFSCTGTGLSYSVASGPSHGTLGAIHGGQVTYTPAAGYSGGDQFTVTASGPGGPSVIDTVKVTVTPVASLADLKATITGPSSAVDGSTFSESVAVSNGGPAAATNVITGLVIPKGLSIKSAGGGSQVGSAVYWTAPSISAGATAKYTITFTVVSGARGTVLISVATASTRVKDPNYANNGAATTVTLMPGRQSSSGVHGYSVHRPAASLRNPFPGGARIVGRLEHRTLTRPGATRRH